MSKIVNERIENMDKKGAGAPLMTTTRYYLGGAASD